MPLAAGTRLGVFEILAPLGKGGMGEVYRAKDTKLGREVAIKVLPDTLKGDSPRLARFRREATLLAALNHPHIASIHGLEETDGNPFLVLELAPGEDLSERVKRGPIPIDEALEIAQQIAEALEAAHEKGIVHRDLKPGNVRVTSEGQVMVLDFGLAKAYAPDEVEATGESQSPTMSRQATQAGVILGTAAYMSPEQARGRPVDKRADIWAFGCVLYEMVAGERPFRGRDATEVAAAIVRAEPDWSLLHDRLPGRLREVLERCLEKEPSRRYHDIADVGLDLERFWKDSQELSAVSPRATRRGVASMLTWGAAAFALGAVLAGAALRNLWPTQPSRPRPVRFSFEAPTAASMRVMTTMSGRLAMSPDGTAVAYVGPREEDPGANTGASARQLYLRRVEDSEGRGVPGTEGAQSPFFSPDGAWVGFVARGKLQRAPTTGGSPLEICNAPLVFGVSWGPDDSIIFGGGIGSGLMRADVAGGEPEPLTSPDATKGEIVHGFPDFLPDGRTVLFTIGTGEGSRLAKLSLETGTWEELLPYGANPHFVFGDYLVFSEQGSLRVTGFDAQEGVLKGPVLPALDDIQWESAAGLEEAYFAVSRKGDLSFLPGRPVENQPFWVDRRGAETPIDVGRSFYFGGLVSPDGRRIAMARKGALGVGEIWLMNIDGSQAAPIAAKGADYNPLWTPDGTTLTYTSNGNLFEKSVDQNDARSALLARDEYLFPQSWSRDGQYLAYMEISSIGSRLWVMQRDGQPEPLMEPSFNSGAARFSPVADWIAYVSDASGQEEVYIRRFPGSERGKRVSRNGGRQPAWSHDGRELYYRLGDQMLAVEIATDPDLVIGEPVELWNAPYLFQDAMWSNYDVAPDGRFLMLKTPAASDAEPAKIHVFLDWLATLEPRMREIE